MEEFIVQQPAPVRISSERAVKMIALRGVVVFPGQAVHFDLARDKSVLALNKAMDEQRDIFLVAQKHAGTVNPGPKDIYRVGTLSRVKQIIKLPNDTVRVLVQGLERMEIVNYVSLVPYFEVTLATLPLVHSELFLMEAVRRKVVDQFEQYRKLDHKLPPDADSFIKVSDPIGFVGFMGVHVFKNVDEKQKLLGLTEEYAQYEEIYLYLSRECEILAVEKKISQKVRQNIDKNQREYYLREQIKVIHDELGDTGDEVAEYRERAKKKKLPKHALDKVNKEISKMERMSPTSPESAVSRTYIEWILDLPWHEMSKETQDLKAAQKMLDEDHYGIEKVKERIVEYLAVTRLTKELSGPILCFVGPPGVGKTSIVASIARASGRKLVTMSLGGVRDEAEIRGHRRTYIGALPGRIVNGMRLAETVNPVFLLDEIDKMSSDFRGDPASAMLEVLDPNQNKFFKDHYLEIDYNLSKVMFVTTANTLDSIAPPLLDRMEIIELSGYTYEEKLQIAKRYLIPKQVKANGLKEKSVLIPDDVIRKIIASYTRESGVRNLEREISAVCRKVAVKIVNGDAGADSVYEVTEKELEEFLGVEKFLLDKGAEADEIGTATGLAWTSVGGVTLTIEVALIAGGKGDIILTGSLGDVMKESCQAAMSLVKSRADRYQIEHDAFKNTDVHIHFPEGATPKDGPSAGITIATALLSAFSGRKVRKTVAMTGEVTLRGKVLPIGGLKEKSLAVFRTGVKKIIVPLENKKDVKDIPAEVLDTLEVVYADNIDTVFENAII
ncbi:MAG: endopeptidase La [Firmicutes bacterium]|nr:endopeptidase La [Bacillota bacterium]